MNSLEGFDYFICDVNIILGNCKNVENADFINTLQKAGKRVIFVSDNSLESYSSICDKLKNFDLEVEDLVTPAMAIISYLKKTEFSQKVYLIGMSAIREQIRDSGLQMAPYGPDNVGEFSNEFLRNVADLDPQVRAVILDTDVNLSYIKLVKAQFYLQKYSAELFIASRNQNVPEVEFFGAKHVQHILEDVTNKKGIVFAKYSSDFNEFLMEKLDIKPDDKVVFLSARLYLVQNLPPTMQDLACVDKEDQLEFLQSFDNILTDVDGVLWLLQKVYPGSVDAIKSLKAYGKNVLFVSNNCTKTRKSYLEEFTKSGLEINPEDLITPVVPIIQTLKENNVSKPIYVLGTPGLKSDLQEAGLEILNLQESNDLIGENIEDLKSALEVDSDVEAVVFDADRNLNCTKLQRVINYLKNPKVLFLSGCLDMKIPFGKAPIIGPGYFQNLVADVSNRKPICLAKPSLHLNQFILDKYRLDGSRTLFIGDQVLEDMGFAYNCGYKKLLVLTGCTKLEDLESWKWPQEFKPDYYVHSLKSLHDILNKIAV